MGVKARGYSGVGHPIHGSASGSSEDGVAGGGVMGRVEQFLYPVSWFSPQLGQQAGEATQQLRTGQRLPSLGQEEFEQQCWNLG